MKTHIWEWFESNGRFVTIGFEYYFRICHYEY
jgi:hypothetical protein